MTPPTLSVVPEPRRRRIPPLRSGVYILPNLFTTGCLVAGFYSIICTHDARYRTAAYMILLAQLCDMLDGRIARLTNSTSAFGVEFDSLADVISFGVAPAVLAFSWGLSELGQVGWAAGFIFLSATSIRLARFNVQSSAQVDKRYFLGMPSPAAAGVVGSTVYAFPELPHGYWQTLAAVAAMLVPAGLMVSTIRYRSFKTINLGWGRSYLPLFGFVLLVSFVATYPKITLPVLAYAYLVSGFIELTVTRMRARREGRPAA